MARKAITMDKSWHLDRRVPISMIAAILLQTATVFWWAASANERINNLEQKATASSTQGDRLTRVEVKLDNLTDSMQEIKSILRREPLPPLTKRP